MKTLLIKKDNNGKLHCDGGPARIRLHKKEKITEYFFHGKRHRINGPAIEWDNGDYEYWVKGRHHRINGPAVKTQNREEWKINGQLHRLDGPAVIYFTRKEWRLNGLLHRIDGPAIEWSMGDNSWYLNDNFYEYDEYLNIIYKTFGVGQIFLIRAIYG
jgi:hypothetical protein